MHDHYADFMTYSLHVENTTRGLTQGCGHICYPEIDRQWVDVTEVSPGPYALRIVIDPLAKLREEREKMMHIPIGIPALVSGIASAYSGTYARPAKQ